MTLSIAHHHDYRTNGLIGSIPLNTTKWFMNNLRSPYSQFATVCLMLHDSKTWSTSNDIDTLARYLLTLKFDKTLEVRTTMAQLIELVKGREIKGSVNRFRITLADPPLIKKNDRYTGSYDIRLTLTIIPAL